MTASVHDYERRDMFESLLACEIVRARRVNKARPRQAPDPATCLVARAQLMQRELAKARELALALFEDAEAASRDDAVVAQLTAMTNLTREVDELMDLSDIDLPTLACEQMKRLRVAIRDRLSGIAHACRGKDRKSIPKLLLVGEHHELRKALFDVESAYALLTRVLDMNRNFDTLCSL